MINSINTNISAYFAQANISAATDQTSISVARLSSGNRVIRASDDVAALSAGTSLRTNVSTLRTALLNSSQGSSLLQVADGALSQITDILQRQKAIAVQAGSGSLDSAARSFLDLEFQNLSSEIDRIVAQTNFNGVKLLNGSLSESADVSALSEQATKATAALTLSQNLSNNQTLIINGVTLTGKTSPTASTTEFQIGATAADTLAALATKLNNAQTDAGFTSAQKLAIGEAIYVAQGNSLTATSRTGGLLGGNFTIQTASTVFGQATESGRYNLLDVGFASATTSVTAATSAIATPFQNGNTITATIGSGPTLTLATLATNDTLTGIVTKINANVDTTGVSASLIFDAASAKFNIRLNYDESGGAIVVSGGANFYAGTDKVNSVNTAPVVAGFGAEYGGSYTNVFAAGFTSSNTSVTAATTATAETPFVVGNVLKATVGDGTAQTLHTLASGDTLASIVDGVNSNAATTGITAELTYDSSAQTYNIRLISNNSVGAIAIDGGTAYYNESDRTHALNTSTGSISLFTSAFGSNATVVSATTAAGATPFQAGDNITATLADGSSITLVSSLAAGLTVSTLADAINESAAAAQYGIFATASSGNITLSYSDPTQGKILAVNGGANYYNVGNTALTNGLNNSYSKLTVFAAGYTAGNSVTAVTAAGDTPFQNGDNIQLTIPGVNSGNAFTVATVATNDTITLIADKINAHANSALYGIHAQVVTSGGLDNLVITYANSLGEVQANNKITFSGGTNYFLTNNNINAASTTTYVTNAPTYTDNTTHQIVHGLEGGVDDGLGFGSVVATGTIGDSILTGLSQSYPKVTISFPDIADADLTSTSNFGASSGVYLTVGGHSFTFTSTAASAKASDEITIGATLAETLDNAVATINAYNGVGSENFQLDQIKVSRSGNTLVFEGKNLANVTTVDGSTSQVSITNFTGVSASNSGALTANTGGVIASNVSNEDFIGTVNNFTATYTSIDTVDLSIKVGDYTYAAKSVSTNPTSATTVRLYSDTLSNGTNGGFFDIVLKANEGVSVSSQTGADSYAQRLKAAFSTLSFYQNREITSYDGGNTVVVTDGAITGSLVGSSAELQGLEFDDVTIDSISVNAPSGGNANGSIVVTINGEDYTTAAGLGKSLGAYQTYRLTSATDSNKYLDFTTGASSIDFSTSAKALAFEEALKKAFGAESGSAGLSFQVGTSTADTLSVSIDNVDTKTLYEGAALNVLTQDSAAAAATAIDVALNLVTSVRANVGALQSRFNFASANIQSSIQNQDAARGILLDTDIAAESTSYATNQVKLQAGISVLAQANQQLQSLLKLIG